LHFVDQGVEHLVLCREVLLDLDGFVEHGIGIVTGDLGPLVGRGCLC
jgi:hypothetical protein